MVVRALGRIDDGYRWQHAVSVPAVWAPRPAARPCSWPARSSSACLRAREARQDRREPADVLRPVRGPGLRLSLARHPVPRDHQTARRRGGPGPSAGFRLFFPGARFLESAFRLPLGLPSGEELLLRVGVKDDDYWDYHGHEYPWIGFEELTNWRDLAFYEMMHSCCRSSMPGMPAWCAPRPTRTAVVTPPSKTDSRSRRPARTPGASSATALAASAPTCTDDIPENKALLAATTRTTSRPWTPSKGPQPIQSLAPGPLGHQHRRLAGGRLGSQRHIVKPFRSPPTGSCGWRWTGAMPSRTPSVVCQGSRGQDLPVARSTASRRTTTAAQPNVGTKRPRPGGPAHQRRARTTIAWAMTCGCV